MVRLAITHGVSVNHLIKAMSAGASASSTLWPESLRRTPVAALVRPNQTTEKFIDRLSAFCSEDAATLRAATFLPIKRAICRSLNTFVKRLRWCPECLCEQSFESETGYLKLAWQVVDLQACRHHRLRLRDSCPLCGSGQKFLRRRQDFFRCESCDGRLDVVYSSIDDHVSDTADQAHDLLALIASWASDPKIEFPEHGVNTSVRKLFDAAWATERELELWRKLPRDECLRYVHDDESVTLTIARRIAFRLDMHLVDLISGDVVGVCRSFGFGLDGPLPTRIAPRKRRRLGNREFLRQELTQIIKFSEGIPPSLRQVAIRLGISVGGLRYHFPRQATEIVQKLVEHKRKQTEAKRAEARREVLSRIANLYETQPRSYTKLGLLREIRLATCLPKSVLYQEIDAVLKVVGWPLG